MENADIIDMKWGTTGSFVDYICVCAVTVTMLIDDTVSTENAYNRYVSGESEWIIGDVILRDGDPLHRKLTERASQLPTLDVTNMQFAGKIGEHGQEIETYAGALFFSTPHDLQYTGRSWWICYKGEGMAMISGDELLLVIEARNNIIEGCRTAYERYCRDRIIVLEIIGDLAQVIHDYLMVLLIPSGQPAILEPTHFVFQ